MGKGGGDQTVTQMVDPQTQKYVQGMRGVAKQGSRLVEQQAPEGGWFEGMNPMIEQALSGMANLGFGPGQVQDWMNPYRAQMGEVFDYQRQVAENQARKQATAMGTFGGAGGYNAIQNALAGVNRQQQEWEANAYNQAVQNMIAGGGMEMQRLGGLLQGGEYQRSLAERERQQPLWQKQQQLNFLNQGIGPYGTTSTQQMQGNPLGGALGGAMTGLSIGGPIGGLVGGGLGLLGGLFG